MSHGIVQLLFGMGVACAARLLLPGHPALQLLPAAVLSFTGALIALALAKRLLPSGTPPAGRFLLSALGALALLLASEIASH